MKRVASVLFFALVLVGCTNRHDFRDQCIAKGGHFYRVDTDAALVEGAGLCLTDDGRVIEIPQP